MRNPAPDVIVIGWHTSCFMRDAMYDLSLQSFRPDDLAVLKLKSDRHSVRTKYSADETTSFSRLLEKASTRQTPPEGGNQSPEQQPAEQPRHATSENNHRIAHAAAAKEHKRPEAAKDNPEQSSRSSAADPSSKAEVDDIAAVSTTDQDTATTPSSPGEASQENVKVMICAGGSGDNGKASVPALPDQLIAALLAALENRPEAIDAVVTPAVTTQSGDSDTKMTSLIRDVVEALQKKLSQPVELDTCQVASVDIKSAGPFSQLLTKAVSANSAQDSKQLLTAFKDLLSKLSSQDGEGVTENATKGSSGFNIIGLSAIPNDSPELRLPHVTDLVKTMLSRVATDAAVPEAVKGTIFTPEKGTELPSEGNAKGGFGEQGATMQATMQRQEPGIENSTTSSFGSIVADRLAALAEQVGSRDKPVDVMLRLKMEGGDSLLVGLKEQAGKTIIQVKSANESLVNLLESQKETIVRHLEAKQISSTISVSAIEEDLTKKQGREQPKQRWGKRREPPSPNVNKSI
jgi:hypothetical protein